MSYEEKFRQKVKESIINTDYPPSYGDKNWNFCILNCYAYALNVNISDPKRCMWVPGVISGKRTDLRFTENTYEWTLCDLDYLGFTYREDDGSPLNPGEYRIAFYYMYNFFVFPIGFHFIRQDSNGEWSEKPSWKDKVHKMNCFGNIPPDLEESNLFLEKVLVIAKK